MGRGGLAILVTLLVGCGPQAREASPASTPRPPRQVESPRPAPRVMVGTCFRLTAGEGGAAAPEAAEQRGGGTVASAPPAGAAQPGDGAVPTDRLARRPVHLPQVRPGSHRVSGSLDTDIIRRVIRRSLPRFRYCYEKQLATNPSLAGKVETRFTIDANGNVVNATVTGLHPEVARCLRQAIRAMKFPKPPGGGIVVVSYPFVFRPGDRDREPQPPVRASDPLGEPAPRADPGQPACVAAAAPRSLLAREASLGECFAPDHKSSERWGALVRVDARGAVSSVELRGLADSDAGACVRDVIAAADFTGAAGDVPGERTLSCSFVLAVPGARAVVMHADELRVSLADISFRGTTVADTYSVAREHGGSWYLAGLASLVRPRDSARLAIEAHPAVDALVVERLTRTVRAAGVRNLGYARQVGTSGTWMVVNPLGTPDWYCRGARAAVAVRLEPEAIEVVGPDREERIPPRDGDLDFARLGEVLTRWRADAALGGRRDLDLAATPGVEYRALLRALEAAVGAGYFDARVVAWETLAAPPR